MGQQLYHVTRWVLPAVGPAVPGSYPLIHTTIRKQREVRSNNESQKAVSFVSIVALPKGQSVAEPLDDPQDGRYGTGKVL